MSVNNCLYWSLERKVGTSTPQVKLTWSSDDCYITNPSTMRLATFEGSLWKNKGYIQSTGTSLNGTVIGLNGNWNRYLTFANILDTATISNQTLLSEVGLFSLLDSINPPGEMHVSGKVVSLWNGDVSSFGEISISDSVFTSYADEYLKISEALTGKNYNDSIINDGDSISGGGYYYLNNDSLIQGLFLLGDSTDKFFIKGGTSLVIGNSGKVVLNGVRRENVFWLLNDLKLDSNSCMYGIVFSNRVELTKEHLGIIQLFSRDNLVFSSSEIFNNAIYLKALDFINEDLRSDYNVINPQTLPCNKILNGDLELGVPPIGIGGIQALNANFWDATAWQNNPLGCNSTGPGPNTPDLFDNTISSSVFNSCIGQNGGLGIPVNFANNGLVNNRLPSSTRHFHSLEFEASNVRLDPSIYAQPGVYLLEFYHAFGNCNFPPAGTSFTGCIGLLPNLGGVSVPADIIFNPVLGTRDWQNNIVSNGNWIQNLACIDLSTSVIPNLSNYNRIGIKPGITNGPNEIFFDDFQLIKVADAGQDQNICIGASVAIGDLDNCLSSVSGVQVDYLWTASPAYTWGTGQNQNTLTNPVVNPTQTTVFTLTVTVTYPDGSTTCSDQDNMTVFVSNFSSPVVNFNLASPYSLCQGQSVNLCTTGTFVLYNWSTGATTQCINVTLGGTYTLTVIDQNGCVGNNSIDIIEIPCCSLSLNLTAENACLPATVGSIEGEITNGAAPYNIAWQQTLGGTASGSFNTSTNPFTIPNLVPGTYSVTVTDVNGCTDMAVVTIISGANPPQASILGSTTTCVNNDTYSVLNSSSNYTYSWSSIPPPPNWPATQSQSIQITNQINPTVGNTTSITYPNFGSYILQVITTNNTTGCFSTTLFPVNECCHTLPSGLNWLNTTSSVVGSTISGAPGNCQSITLAGVFTVDVNTVWTNVCIQMDPGSEIRLQPGRTLSINNSVLSPCDNKFWKSITVNFGSLLQLNGSNVLGAQYAVDVKAGGRYQISNNCNLFDDYVGLRVQGNGSNPNIRFIDDTFIGLNTTATSLYPILIDFNGQIPPSRNTIACPAIPFAGIVLDFALNNQIGSTVLGNQVKIRDGMFGIYSANTFLNVINTNIEDVQSDPCQPFNIINGSGIFAFSSTSTGIIRVTDQGLGSAFRNTIKNCVTGIRTVGVAPIIRGNIIHRAFDGIHASNLPSFGLGNRMEVTDNEIEFIRFGVRINNSPTNFRADFNRNVLYDYSSTGTFNGLSGALILQANRFVGSEVDINDNFITLDPTIWGIFLTGTTTTHIGENQINLDKNLFQRGITVGGCDDLSLFSNHINGSLTSNPSGRLGITITGCGNVNQPTNIFQCNHVLNCADHFSFANPSANIDFDRNIMEIGNKGLRISNVIFGNQLDRYNKWCGNFTFATVDIDQFSFASFRIPAVLPPAPPANCDYDPFNNGGVIGVGTLTIDPTGPNNNPGCIFVPQIDTIYITHFDLLIADSLDQYNISEAGKWQHRRLLAGKLAAQPALLPIDSSMANFWWTNQLSEEVVLALLDDSIRNIYSAAQTSWDEAATTLISYENNNDSLALLDSLLQTSLSSDDSIAVINTMNVYSTQNDSLLNRVDALVIDANEIIQARAVVLISLLESATLQSEQAQFERDYQLFALKYGPWSNEIISVQDTQLIVNLANLCMAEHGFSVEWARNWYAQWYDLVIEDAEVCNNGNRISHTDNNIPTNIDMLFYPNPTAESVLLQISGISNMKDANFVVELYNSEGKMVFSKVITTEKTNLVLEYLNSGVYVAALKQKNQIVNRSKLVIVK